MQKKLIALAVAGMAAAPVFAQSQVTIYGLVDMGVSYRGDHLVRGVGSKTAVDSGVGSGSRLGFRGVEDLGGGLKAGFVLEQGLFADRGIHAQGGRSYGRQSYLSLNGGFGSIQLGRVYTVQNVLMATFDPFEDGFVARASNIYEQSAFGRIDNTIMYTTPSLGGFTVTGAYSMHAGANPVNRTNQEAADNYGDARLWLLSPRYTNGPLDVMANYHRVKLHGVAGAKANKVWDLAAAYDFGVVRLSAMYGQNKDGAAVNRLLDAADPGGAGYSWDKARFWMVGATVPVGAAGKLLASYTRAKVDLDSNNTDKASQWALGYTHNLSKRTDVYAVYADISNKGDSTWGTSTDATNGSDNYQRGFNLGVRHRF